jgi:hypothetical protein
MAAERTPGDVVNDIARLAVAGSSPGQRGPAAKRVRELCDEAFALVREDERRRARKSLAAAWGAWLELAMTVRLDGGESLLAVTLDLAPEETRARFREFILGERPRG